MFSGRQIFGDLIVHGANLLQYSICVCKSSCTAMIDSRSALLVSENRTKFDGSPTRREYLRV